MALAGARDAEAFSQATSADLIVVGAGVLGRRVAKAWREAHGGQATVYTVTRTLSDERRGELEAMGCRPLAQSELEAKPFLHMGAYSNVVFCAPPSGNEDYVGDVQRAAELWNGAGGLVFTSSSGVYAETAGGEVTEDSPVQDSERATRLVAAEREVMQRSGVALRLAGLYTTRRGPQGMFLSREELDMNPDNVLNMIHYSDAAAAVVQVLLESVDDAAEANPRLRGKALHVADGVPLTRKELCAAGLTSPMHSGKSMPKFLQDPAPTGKVMDCSAARQVLPNWRLQYPSFADAMATIPEDSDD